MKRIGMLTSGGDCQALNAAMRGVAKVLYNSTEDVEIYGFQDATRSFGMSRSASHTARIA